MKLETPESPAPPSSAAAPVILRGLGGAVVGGLLGYLLFRWLLTVGFYGLAIPGALLGIGAGLAARGRSQTLGILSGLAALALGVFARWMVDALPQNDDFLVFVMNLHKLSAVTLLMLAFGAACGYWFGNGR